MMYRAAAATLLALVCGCLPVSAQDGALSFSRAEAFNTLDSSDLIHSLPMMGLLDGRRLPVAGPIARMGTVPADLFPTTYLMPAPVTSRATADFDSDKTTAVVAMRAREYYYGGEVGMSYGKSTGKYGGEEFVSYIFGTVGNDKFQITAGASYQESHFRFPRGQYWSR
jgi:hypothetical protein